MLWRLVLRFRVGFREPETTAEASKDRMGAMETPVDSIGAGLYTRLESGSLRRSPQLLAQLEGQIFSALPESRARQRHHGHADAAKDIDRRNVLAGQGCRHPG